MKDIASLKSLHACNEAIRYADKFDTLQDAWNSCERGDWMLWLLGKMSGDPESDTRKKMVYLVCQCARLALPYVLPNEYHPLIAIETAEAYVRGDATLNEVNVAAYNADAAAYNADAAAYNADATVYNADAAAYNADATVYNADAADADSVAACAAHAAAYAAYAAAYAAYTACAADADSAATCGAHAAAYADDAANAADISIKRNILKQCADIVRAHHKLPPDWPWRRDPNISTGWCAK